MEAFKYNVQPGRYRHFKGNEYEVLGMARHSETEEEMVVYRALYGERGLWVRPAAMWCETAKCSRALCALRSEPAVFADGIKRRVILLYSEQKQALAAELSFKHPAVLAVSGSAGSGKTALLAALLPVLKSRGLKVGVIREADDLRLPAETDRLHEAGAEGVAVFTAGRYLLTEQFRLNEQDLLALFERHGYDLVLLEGFGDSGWAKIEVVRSSVSPVGTAFQPMAIVGDVPGADFALDDPAALADWIENQMPSL